MKRNRDTGSRVRAVRVLQGYEGPKEFAPVLDMSRQRLTNIENGHPLSIDVALRLVQAVPGLTLDYLYLGKKDGLTVELARRINCRALTDNG